MNNEFMFGVGFGVIVGQVITYFINQLIDYIKNKNELEEKLADFERKANVCPHGHENWDDCGTCGH
jgi:predicted PurR-regulated permease PerM